MKYTILLPVILALWAFLTGGHTSPGTLRSQPVELGQVHWQRDFDRALKTAGNTDKDVFVLFQEVPG